VHIAKQEAAPRPTARGGSEREVSRVRRGGRPGKNSRVVLRFEGEAAPSFEARVDFQALDIYLGTRLREVLREQLGGIYDVELSSDWTGATFCARFASTANPKRSTG
jgi:hypothetical protein